MRFTISVEQDKLELMTLIKYTTYVVYIACNDQLVVYIDLEMRLCATLGLVALI